MKVTKQQYESVEVHTVALGNNMDYNKWFMSDFRNHSIVLHDNRIIFRQLFGKPDWHYKTDAYFHVWVREFEDEIFLILTAKGKGTCLEMVSSGCEEIQTKSEVIIKFANQLCQQLHLYGGKLCQS